MARRSNREDTRDLLSVLASHTNPVWDLIGLNRSGGAPQMSEDDPGGPASADGAKSRIR